MPILDIIILLGAILLIALCVINEPFVSFKDKHLKKYYYFFFVAGWLGVAYLAIKYIGLFFVALYALSKL